MILSTIDFKTTHKPNGAVFDINTNREIRMNTSLCNLTLCMLSMVFMTSCSTDKIDEVDCDTFGPSLQVSEIIDAECLPTGSITVSVTGGNREMMYSLDGIDFQTSPTFTDLSANEYTILVIDSEGCDDAIMVAVGNQSSDLNFTASTSTGGCGTDEGTITVTPNGGVGEYSYRLGTGNFVSTNIFENVSGGTYNVSVMDAEGCISSGTVKVQSGVSFSTAIKPIIDNNCSVVTCHGDDAALLNFSTHDAISGSAQRIRTQVAAGTMPPEENLSQNQIDQILCWIDDGAINN